MSTEKNITIAEAVRNLIVCDTQFGWTGDTALKLPELLDLQARGWLIEGDENNEFSLTDEGQAVVARALQLAAPAELAEQQGDTRAQFEAWAKRQHYDLAREDGDGRYEYATTDMAWDAWQAALAARQPGAQVPDGVWEALQRIIENSALHGPASNEDAILVARYRRDLLAAPPAQGVDPGQFREIRIPARNKLDPISVFAQDQAAGRGRIVVTCYGNAWQAFWGAMGDRTVMEFVAQCDADYVAGNMISGRQTRMTKAERAYTERIAAEVIAEFRTLIDQRDAAPGVGNG